MYLIDYFDLLFCVYSMQNYTAASNRNAYTTEKWKFLCKSKIYISSDSQQQSSVEPEAANMMSTNRKIREFIPKTND